jgi:hypothetical protein
MQCRHNLVSNPPLVSSKDWILGKIHYWFIFGRKKSLACGFNWFAVFSTVCNGCTAAATSPMVYLFNGVAFNTGGIDALHSRSLQ